MYAEMLRVHFDSYLVSSLLFLPDICCLSRVRH